MVVRHDKPDAAFRERAKAFPQACLIKPDSGGTLVAARWVLTAAHVASDIPRRRHQGIVIAGKTYSYERIVIHPGWKEMGPHDIALIKLKEPVSTVRPARIYAKKDEVGKVLTLVGSGDYGTGLTGPRSRDLVARAATNDVESVTPEWIEFRFDAPGTAGCTELEGVSGPGDSGGGALMKEKGEVYVLGVSVWGEPGQKGKGTYGARDGFARVSSYVDWIEKVIGED
jgi:hypothetical protein